MKWCEEVGLCKYCERKDCKESKIVIDCGKAGKVTIEGTKEFCEEIIDDIVG